MLCTRRVKFQISALLIALPVAAAPEPPLPAAPVALMSVKVKIGDLNLSSEEGRSALESRLSAAARRACGITSSNHVVDRHQVEADCYRDAMSAAHRALFVQAQNAHRAPGTESATHQQDP